ncbi:MAG: hypothetical protein ACYTGH_04995 [Planctomycetota bacterium]|jgi:hypothetical protein
MRFTDREVRRSLLLCVVFACVTAGLFAAQEDTALADFRVQYLGKKHLRAGAAKKMVESWSSWLPDNVQSSLEELEDVKAPLPRALDSYLKMRLAVPLAYSGDGRDRRSESYGLPFLAFRAYLRTGNFQYVRNSHLLAPGATHHLSTFLIACPVAHDDMVKLLLERSSLEYSAYNSFLVTGRDLSVGTPSERGGAIDMSAFWCHSAIHHLYRTNSLSSKVGVRCLDIAAAFPFRKMNDGRLVIEHLTNMQQFYMEAIRDTVKMESFLDRIAPYSNTKAVRGIVERLSALRDLKIKKDFKPLSPEHARMVELRPEEEAFLEGLKKKE